jgi:two-component system sensor histidine kinase AlgZ
MKKNVGPEEDPAKDAENFFLPDFCNVRMVFAVVVIAEMLAIVLTLGPLDRASTRWEDLSIISLFIQWVALISAGILCLARPWLSRMTDRWAATASYVLLITSTTLVSEMTFWTIRWVSVDSNTGLAGHSNFIISNLGISAIVSAVVLRYFYVQHQWGRNIQATSEAKIQALQSRIRPHFLFNSLNTIASLTRTQPEQAEEATLDLADLFRSTLATSSHTHCLRDEWNLCKRYLHIEKLRLGDRLAIDWSVDSVPSDALIPQLTIQPLLENAIYHGIEHLQSGGTIYIKGECNDDVIIITIVNPVSKITQNAQRASNKMAQKNVTMRLEALYGGNAGLTIEESEADYRLTLRMPYTIDS